MIGFVLTGHGDFASGLYSSVEMIAGPQDEFDVVTFHDEAAGEFPQTLRETIDGSLKRNGKVIVFCDLQGGTPFNQAMMITSDMADAEVVAGTNLPMLLEVAMDRTSEDDLQSLVACAVEVGKGGVAHVSFDEPASAGDTEEDGI